MRDERIPERMVDRAVTIWKRALANPIYRNTTPRDREHFQFEVLNAMTAALPKNNTPEVLERFGEALKDILTNGLMVTPDYGDRQPYQLRDRHLSVDYHPCRSLAAAAERAGLKMEFPIKTGMYIGDDHISFSMGYGEPRTYHYPLPDGRWFTSGLSGDPADSELLAAYVLEHGNLPFAKIDAA